MAVGGLEPLPPSPTGAVEGAVVDEIESVVLLTPAAVANGAAVAVVGMIAVLLGTTVWEVAIVDRLRLRHHK